jgi:predicted RNA-binding Zn ribbon-like protein
MLLRKLTTYSHKNNLPPAHLTLRSPYDHEAHYGHKRDLSWFGYKVHFTETCDYQDLEILNKELEKGITGARVIPTVSGFAWEWRKQKGVLDCMLGPLARSAATLLTSAERPLVRQCESASCSWLFVDTTKNHSRVWCRAMICGNKDRARRYRQRQRSR